MARLLGEDATKYRFCTGSTGLNPAKRRFVASSPCSRAFQRMVLMVSGNNSGMWERFFNWQSDMDWAWGPFLPLRPARDVPMRPWVWVRLFAVLSGAGTLLIVLVGMVCVLGPKVAASQHWVVPAGMAETLATLSAMTSDTGFRLAAVGIVFSLPLLFFGCCLPFHLAWNRRALRLAQEPNLAVQVAAEEVPPDVWPPAPRGL